MSVRLPSGGRRRWLAVLGVAQSFVFAAYCLRNVFQPGYLLHNDFVTPLRYTQTFFTRFVSTWDPVAGGFSYNMPKLVLQIPVAFLSTLGVSTAVSYKLLIVFILGLAGASMFVLAYDRATTITTPTRAYAAGTLASLLFTTNPWTLNKIHHHFWLVLGVALLPIIYLLYRRLLDGRGGLGTILALSGLFAVEATQPHSLFIYVAPLLAVTALVHLLASPSRSRAVATTWRTTKLMLVAILVNMFWLLPLGLFYAETSPTPGGYLLTVENVQSLSRDSTILRASHLRSAIGMKDLLAPGYAASFRTGVPLLDRLWPVVGTAITAFALTSLLFDRARARVDSLIFASLLVIGLVLLTGTKPPLGDLYLTATVDAPMGWMLRDPFKFGGLFAFALSGLFGLATANLLESLRTMPLAGRDHHRLRLGPIEIRVPAVGPHLRALRRRLPTHSDLGERLPGRAVSGNLGAIVVVALLVPATLFHGWPMLTGDANDHFEPSTVPDEYHQALEWLDDNATHGRVLWLPHEGFSVADPNVFWYTWPTGIARHHVRGSKFQAFSTAGPVMAQNPSNERLRMWLHQKLLDDTIERPSVPLQAAGVGYVAFHTDVVARSQADRIHDRLRLDPAVTPVFSAGNVTVFEIEDGSFVRAGRLFETTDLDLLDTLYQPDAPTATAPPVTYSFDSNLTASAGVVTSGEPTPWYRDLGTTVSPFDATPHHLPSVRWSKAQIHDPWQGRIHRYLAQRGIDTWQTDYDEGLAFTWAEKGVPAGDAGDELVEWRFVGPDIPPGWESLDAEQTLRETHGHLKATLNESGYGWKRIAAPPVDVDPTGVYRFKFDVFARNGHAVHAKIAEYDADGDRVHVERVADFASGDFDRDDVTVDYVPRNSTTTSLRLQIWHGHETTQPFPNEIRLDDVSVTDRSGDAREVTLRTTVTLDQPGEYRLLGRYFQNRDGGMIAVSVDNRTVPVQTDASFDRFVWKDLATLNLSAGTHTVTVENLHGFNAVNLLSFVPAGALAERRERVDRLLADATVAYHFDAAGDLRKRDAREITRRRDGRERPLLTLRTGGRAWRTIDLLASGEYTLTARGSGSFVVHLDDRTLRIDNATEATERLGPLDLDRGRHRLRVEPVGRAIHTIDFEASDDWWTGTDGFSATRVEDWSGDATLRVETTTTDRRWGWIHTDPIAVDPGRAYEFGARLKLRDVAQSHVVVQGYDRSLGEWRRLGVVTDGRSGTTDWQRYRNVLDLPSDVRRIRFALNAGWSRGGEPATTWFDDLEIRGVRFNTVDTITLAKTPSGESLSDDSLPEQSPSGDSFSDDSLSEVIHARDDVATVESFEQVRPTRYRVDVIASQPHALTLARGYDPLWVAEVHTDDGVETYEPIATNGATTSFRIDETGSYSVTIRYRPQSWLGYGTAISLGSVVVGLGLLTARRWSWHRLLAIRRRVERRLPERWFP